MRKRIFNRLPQNRSTFSSNSSVLSAAILLTCIIGLFYFFNYMRGINSNEPTHLNEEVPIPRHSIIRTKLLPSTGKDPIFQTRNRCLGTFWQCYVQPLFILGVILVSIYLTLKRFYPETVAFLTPFQPSQRKHITMKGEQKLAREWRQVNPIQHWKLNDQELELMRQGAIAWNFPGQEGSILRLLTNRDTSVQTSLPLPHFMQLAYYEVKILKVSRYTTLAIGLACSPYPKFRLPGYEFESYAYHSDDGQLYVHSIVPFQNKRLFSSRYKLGDTIGVGYDQTRHGIFFTLNGILVKRKEIKIQLPSLRYRRENLYPYECAVEGVKSILWPTIGTDGNVTLQINFGSLPFIWRAKGVRLEPLGL